MLLGCIATVAVVSYSNVQAHAKRQVDILIFKNQALQIYFKHNTYITSWINKIHENLILMEINNHTIHYYLLHNTNIQYLITCHSSYIAACCLNNGSEYIYSYELIRIHY